MNKNRSEESTPENIDQGRRDFLIKIARASVLVAIGAYAGRLILKDRISLPGRTGCVNNSICARCRLSSGCILPQAQSFRSVKIKKDNV